MAEATVNVPGTGAVPIDVTTVTDASSVTRNRQIMTIGDPNNAAGQAGVNNAAPSSSDYGLVTRPIPSGVQSTVDTNKQGLKFVAQVLTASATLTPTSGKAIKIVKTQVMQNPDNSSSNQVTLNFASIGNFFTGWVGSDTSEVIGATNEVLNITLANAQQVSLMIRYKEV